MIQFSQLNDAQILLFALILLRMIGFVVSAAIFGSAFINVQLKVLISIVLALVIYAPLATNENLVRVSELENQLLLLSVREVMLGVILGFMTRLFFFTISMAGEIVSVSLGLGQAQIFNPMMGSMSNAMEQFYTVLATLLFLMLNGHHFLIQGVFESFTAAPVALMQFEYGSFSEVVMKIQNLLIIAVKISAPILVSMIIVQVGIALLSRVVPQINVFMTSASITIIVGYVVMFISLPLLLMQISGLVDFSVGEFFKFIKAI